MGPSNAPLNYVAPLKIITYRAIKTTGTLIVILELPVERKISFYPSGIEIHSSVFEIRKVRYIYCTCVNTWYEEFKKN